MSKEKETKKELQTLDDGHENISKKIEEAIEFDFAKDEDGQDLWLVDVNTLPDRELTTDEMVVVSLFLRQFSVEEIASATGKSRAFIRNTLALPRAEHVITQVNQALETEITGMKGLAVKAMRDVLMYGDAKSKSTMVEKYFKIVGRYEENEKHSAEDVIASLVNIIKEQGEVNKELTMKKANVIDMHNEPQTDNSVVDADLASDGSEEEMVNQSNKED